MLLAHIIAYFSWPIFALGVVGIVFLRWRKRRGEPDLPFVGLMVIAFLGLPIVANIAWGETTQANLLDENLTHMLFGAWFLSLAPRTWRNASKPPTRPNDSPTRRRVAAVLAGVLGTALIVASTATVIGDFVIGRSAFEGFVTGKYITHPRYGPTHYYLKINGYDFPITEDLYGRIGLASHVRVSVGRLTHTIFQISTKP